MSWEATCWVMERSAHKGCDLFALLLIANDMNNEGRGTFSTRKKLARQMRVNERTVMRILRRLEHSEELVCEARGSGHAGSVWRIPGVVADGFAAGMRGGKLPPQGRRIALPGEAKCPPRGGKVPPIPLLPTVLTVDNSSIPPPPPPDSAAAAEKISPEYSKRAPQELRDWLIHSAIRLDRAGADRLWQACRARVPECTPLQIMWACQHKLQGSRGARNLAGLIIATVPDLLMDEMQAEGVARGGKNNA
jgi:hypothetical protein